VSREAWSAVARRRPEGPTVIPDLATTSVTLDTGLVEYRFERRPGPTVLVLHGGHMRAGLALGEDVFLAAGYSVLVPSRPGYGRTPLSTGRTAAEFADATRKLCAHLGIDRLAAVVGVSAGGPIAVTTAVRHPDLVERLILISAVGPLPYPTRVVRAGARVVFAPRAEGATWAVLRMFLRRAPDLGLRMLLGPLSVLPWSMVEAGLSAQDRRTLIELFSRMRSGAGFRHDLGPVPDVAGAVGQPTLVIATRNVGSVTFAHAQASSAAIRHARLIESRADTHFVWFGPDWPEIGERIRVCLTTEPAP
jgi:pimeloyl-ACP methyl ester carboxylesterase